MLNIVIFSGGSGSISLQNGLKSISKYIKITNIINAYDDGKSTGICRKIMNVLGPSDVRKNQFIQYLNSREKYNQSIISFFDKRYDLPKNKEKDMCIKLLKELKLNEKFILEAIDIFFENYNSKYEFKDFNLANIVYSAMFKKYGYENTIKKFSEFLEIDDNVILNSYDNLFLKAKTKNGKIINSESDIVNFNNENDKIEEIYFKNDKNENILPKSNTKVLETIYEADLIIFSSGTQWSSLIPTYMTIGINDALEKTKAKKILIMNNSQDKDMIGIDGENILNIISKYVNLKNIIILFNEDADKKMNFNKNKKNYKIYKMGNFNGKHDPKLLAKFCLYEYYGLDKIPNLLLFDFDDTIYSRNDDEYKISLDNINLLNEISLKYKSVLITGNSFIHLYDKLNYLKEINFEMWADGGIINYKNNKRINTPNKYKVEKINEIIEFLYYNLKIDPVKISKRGDNEFITCISIRPLNNEVRIILKECLNLYFEKNKINNIAKITGKTTIDIFCKETNKIKIFDENIDYNNYEFSFYIGDECEIGNDKEIANKCYKFYNVKSIYDTNILMTLLKENYE